MKELKISFKKIKAINEVKIDKTFDFAVRNEHRIIARKNGSKAAFYTSNCWHADIEEFITAKQTSGRLTKFNMSILITDKLIDAVKNNKPWDLIFPDFDDNKQLYDEKWDGDIEKWQKIGGKIKVYKTFKNANELWDLIMKSTYNRNEPGVLFVDTINKLNNLYYCEHISATNPCVIGDTLVLTNIGWIKIKNLQEHKQKYADLKIITRNKEGEMFCSELEWSGVTNKEDDLYKVEFSNGEFLLTNKKHKFYKEDWSEISVQQILDMQGKEEVCVLGMSGLIKINSVNDIKQKEDVYDLTAKPNYNFFCLLNREENIITEEIVINDNLNLKYFDLVNTNKGKVFAFEIEVNDEIIE
jgi:ribonucleotide reductase alpha subunit